MPADPARPTAVTRRTALAGLSAGGIGVALAATARSASAQDAATVMANHPMVGTWLVGTTANDLQLVHLDADGNMDFQGSVAPTVTDGVTTYNDPFMGVWEPDGERGIHVTFTWATRDASGAVTGTTTIDGYPVASDDGNSFVDDGTKVVATLRDPAGTVTQEITGVPRVTGVRVTPGKPGYEEVLGLIAAAATATPTS